MDAAIISEVRRRRLEIAFGAELEPGELASKTPDKALALSAAFGYLNLDEVRLMGGLAETVLSGGVYVNIGAGPGTSSLCVAEVAPSLKRYTVDISPGSPIGGMDNEVVAFRNAEILDLLPVQILGDSKEIGRKWENGAIDFLFIDGDHSYAGCTGDIEAWVQHMKPGGIIAIHDYEPNIWRDVWKATNEAAEKYGWKQLDHKKTLIAFEV